MRWDCLLRAIFAGKSWVFCLPSSFLAESDFTGCWELTAWVLHSACDARSCCLKLSVYSGLAYFFDETPPTMGMSILWTGYPSDFRSGGKCDA